MELHELLTVFIKSGALQKFVNVLTAVLTFIGVNDKWNIKSLIKCAFPVTYDKFWYFTAFFVLFLIIPALNKYLFSIGEDLAKKSFVVLAILFSIMGTIADPFKTKNGYSALWIIVLYCIGALAKRIKLFETKKNITLIALWIFCDVLTWALYIYKSSGVLIQYISPTMLINALVMVVLFSRIKVKGTIIRRLSPYAFGIYLCQLSPLVWSRIITNRFVFVAEKRLRYGVIYVLLLAAVVFVIGLIVEVVRSQLAKLLKVSELSKLIVKAADKLIGKVFILLK